MHIVVVIWQTFCAKKIPVYIVIIENEDVISLALLSMAPKHLVSNGDPFDARKIKFKNVPDLVNFHQLHIYGSHIIYIYDINA